jgi:predicted nucleic acid-binding protein
LIITQEILSEYVEVIGRKASPSVANNVAELLLNLTNVYQVEIFYRWNLIVGDMEDNKFVDAAICANADFIVTNDKHFSVLEKIEFPTVKCLSSDQFIDMLSKG